MALRKRPIVAGMAALLFSGWVSALGLGEIELNSALNEPLDAEIPLINVGDLEKNEIIVTLATAQQFEKAGVSRELILSSLKFRVDMDAPDGPVLRVNTQKPIREPYLDFLVDVQWPAGRLLREYTLLLDLPVYARSEEARERLQSRSSDTPSRTADRPDTRPAEGSGTTAPPRPSPPEGVVASGDEYRVRDGNTLWSIASELPTNVSVHKKMAAIQQLNPDAFIDGDINRLRRDAVLRLPDMEQIRSAEGAPRTASSAAAAERSTDSAPQLSGSRRTESSAGGEPSEDSGRLRLSAPEAGEEEDEGGGALGAGGGGDAAVRNELDTLGEELSRTRRENQNLKKRLSSLEEQIATMERLFELGDEDLRAAQLAAMTDNLSEEEMEEAARVLAENDLIEEEDLEASPALALFPSANQGSSRRSGSSGSGDGGAAGKGDDNAEGETGDPAGDAGIEEGGSGEDSRVAVESDSGGDGVADSGGGEAPADTAGQPAQQDRVAEEAGDQPTDDQATASPDEGLNTSGSANGGSMNMKTEKKEGWFETVSSYLLYLIGALVIAGIAVFFFFRRGREESDYTETPARRQTPPPAPRAPDPEVPEEPRSRVSSVDDIDLDEEDDLFGEPEPGGEPPAFDDATYTEPRREEVPPVGEPEPAPEPETPSEPETSPPDDELELDLSAFELDDPGTATAEPQTGSEDGEQNVGELNLDEEFDLLGDVDEGDTQLELAQAYIEMGDHSGAREILQEVAENGNDAQQGKARELLQQIT